MLQQSLENPLWPQNHKILLDSSKTRLKIKISLARGTNLRQLYKT